VRRIAHSARGFVYAVSVAGVTGERAALPPGLGEVVEGVRAAADVPVAVGFGVATPDQVAQVAEIADGVIVGSRLVRSLADAATLDAGLDEVRSFMEESAARLTSG
jgi:tryptophan synthase alpha chain